jgi:hypothetical protein
MARCVTRQLQSLRSSTSDCCPDIIVLPSYRPSSQRPKYQSTSKLSCQLSKMASHGLKCSKCSDCGSSSDDGVWQEDVAEDLNTFVRLSKAGHFTRAEEFFHEFLESHAGDFAVAAQYAESLIEQGSFGPAEEFLTAWLSKDVNADDEEMTVVRLLLATSRLYTRFDVREVGITALSSLERVGKVLIAENKSLLKVSDRNKI